MSIPIVEAWNKFINQPLRPAIANMFLKDDPYIHVDAIATTTNSGVDAYRSSDGGYYIPAREGSTPPTIQSLFSNSFSDIKNPRETSSSGRAPSTPQQVVYTDAPYAEMYGMSAETAYQEALLNTAHQREVADLKAAGLNPVLGISGSGAGSGASPVLQGAGSVNSGKSGSSSDFLDALPYLLSAAGAAVAFKFSKTPSAISAAASSAYNLGQGIKVLFD